MKRLVLLFTVLAVVIASALVIAQEQDLQNEFTRKWKGKWHSGSESGLAFATIRTAKGSTSIFGDFTFHGTGQGILQFSRDDGAIVGDKLVFWNPQATHRMEFEISKTNERVALRGWYVALAGRFEGERGTFELYPE